MVTLIIFFIIMVTLVVWLLMLKGCRSYESMNICFLYLIALIKHSLPQACPTFLVLRATFT